MPPSDASGTLQGLLRIVTRRCAWNPGGVKVVEVLKWNLARNVQAMVNRSAAYIELDQLEEAQRDCTAALRLSPLNVQV